MIKVIYMKSKIPQTSCKKGTIFGAARNFFGPSYIAMAFKL